MARKPPKDLFLSLSSALTGFTMEELHGTGMLDTYYTKFTDIVDSVICARLWDTWYQVVIDAAPHGRQRLDELIRARIYNSPEYGPLARNIIGMWYLGNWSQLPAAWRSQFGAKASDSDRVISAEAYQQGLVWSAMGSHPAGAKQPGYGSWAQPPVRLVAQTIAPGGYDVES
jgi:hypothetical protein